jgi:hypothetical protein
MPKYIGRKGSPEQVRLQSVAEHRQRRCRLNVIGQRVPEGGRSKTKGTMADGGKTVGCHFQPTGCRRPKAAATGKVSRTLQNVQVRWCGTMTMKDAISSDGKPEDDALGDAKPVQHRHRHLILFHVIMPPQPESESCSCIEDRL